MSDQASGANPVECRVRPSLDDALAAYWDAAYNEGRNGRTHDTVDGAAQRVQLARVLAAVDEPDFAQRHVQLGKFYGAANTDELIDRLNAHVCRLQAKSLHPVARVAEVHMSRYTIEWLGEVFPEGTLLHWARPVTEFSFAPQFVRG